MILRRTLASALPAIAALLLATTTAARAEDAARYCRHVGTDDTLRPVPPALVPESRHLFGLRMSPEQVMHTTVFRCMDGAVLVCTTGANLPCGKANTARDLPGADRFCGDHPGSDFIPMYATGHDTIWCWRCEGPHAIAGGPAEQLDSRDFIARFWKRTNP